MNTKTNEKFLKVVKEVLDKEITRIGITKKDKSPNKKARKQSKASRKINRSKKRHSMTKKEKKSR